MLSSENPCHHNNLPRSGKRKSWPHNSCDPPTQPRMAQAANHLLGISYPVVSPRFQPILTMVVWSADKTLSLGFCLYKEMEGISNKMSRAGAEASKPRVVFSSREDLHKHMEALCSPSSNCNTTLLREAMVQDTLSTFTMCFQHLEYALLGRSVYWRSLRTLWRLCSNKTKQEEEKQSRREVKKKEQIFLTRGSCRGSLVPQPFLLSQGTKKLALRQQEYLYFFLNNSSPLLFSRDSSF